MSLKHFFKELAYWRRVRKAEKSAITITFKREEDADDFWYVDCKDRKGKSVRETFCDVNILSAIGPEANEVTLTMTTIPIPNKTLFRLKRCNDIISKPYYSRGKYSALYLAEFLEKYHKIKQAPDYLYIINTITKRGKL